MTKKIKLNWLTIRYVYFYLVGLNIYIRTDYPGLNDLIYCKKVPEGLAYEEKISRKRNTMILSLSILQ